MALSNNALTSASWVTSTLSPIARRPGPSRTAAGCALRAGFVHIPDNQGASFSSQAVTDGLTESLGSAGHNGDFSFKHSVHWIWLLSNVSSAALVHRPSSNGTRSPRADSGVSLNPRHEG